jgi:hypothetical protein
MHMIRHQAIRVHRATEPHRKFPQVIKVGKIVFYFEETVSLIVPALHDMETDLGNYHARRSRHIANERGRRRGG